MNSKPNEGQQRKTKARRAWEKRVVADSRVDGGISSLVRPPLTKAFGTQETSGSTFGRTLTFVIANRWRRLQVTSVGRNYERGNINSLGAYMGWQARFVFAAHAIVADWRHFREDADKVGQGLHSPRWSSVPPVIFRPAVFPGLDRSLQVPHAPNSMGLTNAAAGHPRT